MLESRSEDVGCWIVGEERVGGWAGGRCAEDEIWEWFGLGRENGLERIGEFGYC